MRMRRWLFIMRRRHVLGAVDEYDQAYNSCNAMFVVAPRAALYMSPVFEPIKK